MGAAQIGELGGFFLADAGIGYIVLGLLWATRIYKRWPRASTWSAVGVAAIIGVQTAVSSGGSALLYVVGTLLACGFIIIRGRKILFHKTEQVTLA